MTRIEVKDAAGRNEAWSIVQVLSSDVPRPDWIAAQGLPASTAQRAAWALWLWSVAGQEWRLLALSMLEELAGHEYLARYARDSIVAGSEEFTP